MYLPPESSVSCHLHETAGALRHPRVLTLRFRAHTKNTGALPRSRSRALAQTPALPLPRTRARTQNAGAPPTHYSLSQNEGGTGFAPRPAFLRPDISTGCLCGRARCRLVFGCRPRLLVAAGIRLSAALPALRPIGDGASSWSASVVPPARSLRAACRRGPAARRLTVARPGAAQPIANNLLANDLLAALKLLARPVAPVVQRVGFGHGAVAEHQAMRAAVGLENAGAQEDVRQAEHGNQ